MFANNQQRGGLGAFFGGKPSGANNPFGAPTIGSGIGSGNGPGAQLAGQFGNLTNQLTQFNSDNENLHTQVATLQQRLQNANSYNDQLKQQLGDPDRTTSADSKSVASGFDSVPATNRCGSGSNPTTTPCCRVESIPRSAGFVQCRKQWSANSIFWSHHSRQQRLDAKATGCSATGIQVLDGRGRDSYSRTNRSIVRFWHLSDQPKRRADDGQLSQRDSTEFSSPGDRGRGSLGRKCNRTAQY